MTFKHIVYIVLRCGSCYMLTRAGTKIPGTQGQNLWHRLSTVPHACGTRCATDAVR